jgi:hypothetical protein
MDPESNGQSEVVPGREPRLSISYLKKTARKPDFFPKWEMEIGDAAHEPF